MIWSQQIEWRSLTNEELTTRVKRGERGALPEVVRRFCLSFSIEPGFGLGKLSNEELSTIVRWVPDESFLKCEADKEVLKRWLRMADEHRIGCDHPPTTS